MIDSKIRCKNLNIFERQQPHHKKKESNSIPTKLFDQDMDI